ncbi:MAG TPA: hypothetical protein VHO25_21075 [Polyangiaceae bacterium]|nr:hypothetical protein [Polyangiaceae bacterium]
MGEEADIGDFPPTVVHVEASLTPEVSSAELPWEKSMALPALWRTALQVTVQAERVGATFLGQGVMRAALFAFLAELIAIGSLAVTLGLLVVVLFPKQVFAALLDAVFVMDVLRITTGIVVGLASALVLLHWLWTLGTELGAWRNDLPRRVRTGLALSGYSCGWDLITSPFGILAVLFTRGWRNIGPTLNAALRAPRRCSVAHLEQARGFSIQQRLAVFTFAAWLTGPIVLALSLALLVAFVLAMA